MRAGEFKAGSRVLRAKIDMTSPNVVMRDPVIYRILHQEHHRTGVDWCIYPLYDFTHCLSDSLEGITHSLCTLEFENNREWLLTYFMPDLIITKGKDGAVLNFAEEFSIEHEHEVRDLSGAGDTFLAALVANYVTFHDIRSSIRFANRCAAWVVSQKGVVVVNPEKI